MDDRTGVRREILNLKCLAVRFGPVAACVLAIPLIFALCNPFVEIGANDDWTYIQMARVWSETGSFRLNGWSTAMVGPQAAWGMAIIRLFGFSFSVIRASMMPFAAGCSVLMYCIARWTGASRELSLLAGMALVLSPLFVPVATTFMTDVPALCLFLATLYCALRATVAPRWKAVMWVGGAALAGVTGGAIRQIIWGAPILMICAFAVMRRKDRLLVSTAAGMLVAIMITVLCCLHWQYSQPFPPPREVLTLPHTLQDAHLLLHIVAAMVLTTAFCCLPAMSCLLAVRRVWRGELYTCAGAIGLTALAPLLFPQALNAPWLGNILTKWGVLNEGEVILGNQPIILSTGAGLVIGTLTVAALAFAVITAIRLYRVWNPRKPCAESRANGDRLATFWWIAVPFCVCAPAPILLRSQPVFDRYLLPIVSCALIGFIAIAGRLPGKRIVSLSWVYLLLAGSYGVATTHDWFRLLEAQDKAANRLTGIGIVRECIMGGYEYDGWTELSDAGHILVPPNDPLRHTPAAFPFSQLMPHVKPRYYLVTSRQAKLAPSVFLEIPYSTWFAPHRRTVLVQVDPGVSCPDATGRRGPMP